MKSGVYHDSMRGKCWWVSFPTSSGWVLFGLRPFNWRVGFVETDIAWRVYVGPFEIEEVML